MNFEMNLIPEVDNNDHQVHSYGFMPSRKETIPTESNQFKLRN